MGSPKAYERTNVHQKFESNSQPDAQAVPTPSHCERTNVHQKFESNSQHCMGYHIVPTTVKELMYIKNLKAIHNNDNDNSYETETVKKLN
jgi:hypothetical protein